LTGDGGFLSEIIKSALKRGLAAEQTAPLSYERGDPARRGTANSRNGTTPKTVATEVGDVALDVPRDRAWTFEPRLVRKGLTAHRRSAEIARTESVEQTAVCPAP
jgi:putative transposase